MSRRLCEEYFDLNSSIGLPVAASEITSGLVKSWRLAVIPQIKLLLHFFMYAIFYRVFLCKTRNV